MPHRPDWVIERVEKSTLFSIFSVLDRALFLRGKVSDELPGSMECADRDRIGNTGCGGRMTRASDIGIGKDITGRNWSIFHKTIDRI